jgi:hypothetical protein
MADVNSSNMILPSVAVSSTGGNTALYETANKGGGKKSKGKRGSRKVRRTARRRGNRVIQSLMGFLPLTPNEQKGGKK